MLNVVIIFLRLIAYSYYFHFDSCSCSSQIDIVISLLVALHVLRFSDLTSYQGEVRKEYTTKKEPCQALFSLKFCYFFRPYLDLCVPSAFLLQVGHEVYIIYTFEVSSALLPVCRQAGTRHLLF